MKATALAAATAFALVAAVSVAAAERPARSLSEARAVSARTHRTIALRDTARRWEVLIGLPRARTRFAASTGRAYRFWRTRARAVVRIAGRPPHKSGWLCIHRYEGGWGDDGDPYWGGLQMDRGFMSTYAPRSLLRKGWANRWTPLEQMWVAERAHRSGRGYGPWPNTARFCGLL